jgi:signal transduction histidine kinase
VAGGDDGVERIHLYQPVALDEGLRGAIEFSEPLVGGPEILAGRLATLVAVAALLVAACGSVAYLVSQRWVEWPLGTLIGKARRIGAEDFSAPVRLEGHREFDELAGEMNLMATKLEAARTRVESETAARIRAIEQLRHADRLSTIGRLAAGIAHELGTPLNVVSERAEMIAQGEHADPDGAAQSALVIRQQAMRMAGIVRRLLDFARRPQPDRRSTPLGELARSAARLVTPLLERRGVEVQTLDASVRVCCDVDPGQIQQVLINLLTNAVDVTPRGGEVRIRVERSQDGPPGATACGPFACLSVEDDGPGLAPEQRARIFEPFFTTKPAGQGTGLGLAVSEEIVREHGGSITVESEVGSGTRLRVWLPLESGA